MVLFLYSVYAVIIFCVMLYAIYSSSTAVALGVATFGLEQITAIVLPNFQVDQTLFNIIIGCVICASLVVQVLRLRISRFKKRECIQTYALIVMFASYYWITAFWSPFRDFQSNKVNIYYFVLYVGVLPFLIADSGQMIKGFGLLWLTLLVGFAAVIISGDIEILISSQIGRSQFILEKSELITNPLALADSGILLAMTSMLVILYHWKKIDISGATILRIIVIGAAASGIVLGMWVSMISSRAESMMGLLCVVTFYILANVNNVRRALIFAGVTTAIVSCAAVYVYIALYDTVVYFFPVFSQSELNEGWFIRLDLISKSLGQIGKESGAIIYGIGARGCEHLIGFWPHNAIVQSITESGLIGFCLYMICIGMILKIGYDSIKSARKDKDWNAKVWTAFVMCMFLYNLVMNQKKGSLSDHDACMWMAFAVVAFDHARTNQKVKKEIRRTVQREQSQLGSERVHDCPEAT